MQCVAPDRVATVRTECLLSGRCSGNLCVKIFHYVIQELSILNILIPVHILLQNFVTILFNIIFPLKFMSVNAITVLN